MSPFSTSNGHDFPGLLDEPVPGFATEGDDESHHEPLGNPPRESQSPQLGISGHNQLESGHPASVGFGGGDAGVLPFGLRGWV